MNSLNKMTGELLRNVVEIKDAPFEMEVSRHMHDARTSLRAGQPRPSGNARSQRQGSSVWKRRRLLRAADKLFIQCRRWPSSMNMMVPASESFGLCTASAARSSAGLRISPGLRKTSRVAAKCL